DERSHEGSARRKACDEGDIDHLLGVSVPAERHGGCRYAHRALSQQGSPAAKRGGALKPVLVFECHDVSRLVGVGTVGIAIASRCAQLAKTRYSAGSNQSSTPL